MKHPHRAYALVAAAGAGKRLLQDLTHGSESTPKAFLTLCGKPMFYYSLATMRESGIFEGLYLLVPPSHVLIARQILSEDDALKDVKVVAGGQTRQESVFLGLQALPNDAGFVLIHDAARPFITAKDISACLSATIEHKSAICAMPASDTIKTTNDGQWVVSTLERDKLWAVQTPQGFEYNLIMQAHREAREKGILASDDAGLVEALGGRVKLVESSVDNIKITRKADLETAELMMQKNISGQPNIRIGLGFDSHAFAEDRKLILAGVEFPPPGLLGHSDADLICHAVADALLGAAGLGDIGTHFPDTDPQYAGASSIMLLERVADLLAQAGCGLNWLDIVLAAERPKIAVHSQEMKQNLARALKVDAACISLKGKTTEGLGFVGRKEGMACWAVCLLCAH